MSVGDGVSWRMEQGDCLDVLRELDESSIDAVIADPPYGIGFMGHEWDQPGEHGPIRANGNPAPFAASPPSGGSAAAAAAAAERQARRSQRRATQRDPASGAGHEYERRAAGYDERTEELDHTRTRARGGAMHAGRYDLSPTANRRFQAWCEAWAVEALRVLKPGGHLLAFGGTRTYHRLACAVEDAGFEIRDSLIWLYGSGFPKSLNIGEGRGTALKPGHELIVVARKPLIGTVAANVEQHGTGALNIDGCRIEAEPGASLDGGRVSSSAEGWDRPYKRDPEARAAHFAAGAEKVAHAEATGRWPANVALSHTEDCTDECAPSCSVAELDGQSGQSSERARTLQRSGERQMEGWRLAAPSTGQVHGDSGGASRFFYTAKASRAERNAGLDGFEERENPTRSYDGMKGVNLTRKDGGKNRVLPTKNAHPTVKPLALMRWLVRLVTPGGGLVLDPFAGSGTTGCAAVLEGVSFVGIEREPEYAAIAEARIAHWAAHPVQLGFEELVA